MRAPIAPEFQTSAVGTPLVRYETLPFVLQKSSPIRTRVNDCLSYALRQDVGGRGRSAFQQDVYGHRKIDALEPS